MTRPPLKALRLKVWIQKIITVLVVQGIVYGIFLIIDPGFLDSLMIYFIFVAIGSIIAVSVAHIRSEIKQEKQVSRSFLDEPDYAGERHG